MGKWTARVRLAIPWCIEETMGISSGFTVTGWRGAAARRRVEYGDDIW